MAQGSRHPETPCSSIVGIESKLLPRAGSSVWESATRRRPCEQLLSPSPRRPGEAWREMPGQGAGGSSLSGRVERAEPREESRLPGNHMHTHTHAHSHAETHTETCIHAERQRCTRRDTRSDTHTHTLHRARLEQGLVRGEIPMSRGVQAPHATAPEDRAGHLQEELLLDTQGRPQATPRVEAQPGAAAGALGGKQPASRTHWLCALSPPPALSGHRGQGGPVAFWVQTAG